jgi:uncharacterized caspase-like protein
MSVTLAALFAARALLIGINDYTASTLKAVPNVRAAPGRDWPDLTGAVNDVQDVRDLLVARYEFPSTNVITLIDQQATRGTILGAIQSHLIDGVQQGDTVFFYFAGHGSQVLNSKSDEPDKLDESIVPADSRRGAPDIHDKELRRYFNAILDRGAKLTVMIDACHSGSGARGLPTGAQPRGIAPDLRDVADGGPFGPRPENRGALVLAASHDFDSAWETRDEQHHRHGAFTLAWMRALRDASPVEPVVETFARAQARLRSERPFQEPVLAGNDTVRRTPFLGTTERNLRGVIAVQRVSRDGIAVLEGGWAHGLSVGTELRSSDGIHLVVTSVEGLVRSTARVEGSRVPPSGALLDIIAWAAPPPEQLQVAIPKTKLSQEDLRSLATSLKKARDLRWITDPVVTTPEYLLRWNNDRWELLHDGKTTRYGSPAAAVATIPRGGSFFFQLPIPFELAGAIRFAGNAVMETEPEEADYILTGRFYKGRIEYAWVRPGVSRADRRKTSLPLRTTWLDDDAVALRYRALQLHKIVAWNALESPPRSGWPFHLDVPQRVTGNETYPLELKRGSGRLSKRHVYVFAIDSYGQSTLLFPPSGSVENRFPIGDTPPQEIPLGRIWITPPYGTDTYFLLTTEEPLSNPWVLQWDGIRGEPPKTPTALEQLLAQASSARRSATSLVTPAEWSIERVIVESVRPRSHKTRAAVSHVKRPSRAL